MSSVRQLSPHPQWVDSLHGYVKPYWDDLLNGEWAEAVTAGRLTIPPNQGWIIQIYSLIPPLPKLLAEALFHGHGEYTAPPPLSPLPHHKTPTHLSLYMQP